MRTPCHGSSDVDGSVLSVLMYFSPDYLTLNITHAGCNMGVLPYFSSTGRLFTHVRYVQLQYLRSRVWMMHMSSVIPVLRAGAKNVLLDVHAVHFREDLIEDIAAHSILF